MKNEKALVTGKIRCPFHEERTASCAIYGNRFYCFGCGKKGLTKDLPAAVLAEQPKRNRPVASVDMGAELERIRLLPVARIRGVDLPYDAEWAYIVWPDGLYYKKRHLFKSSGNKYINCPGAKPIYVPHRSRGASRLFIVEGELNALSLSLIRPRATVCSPGSATQLSKYIDFYLTFNEFTIIVDMDKPGIGGAIELKKALVGEFRKPFVSIHPMETKDMNDILMEEGLSGIKKQANLAMPGSV